MPRNGPRPHLRTLLEAARSSLWLVPSAMVLGAIALSTLLLALDERLARDGSGTQWWLFEGNAEGARTLLSVIAGSLITVVSVAFSVTMIAIQQAATQYTPRVLRNYTSDRGNQLVLGVYIATFTYALLVLREVREDGDGGGFVPTWSLFVAMLLALASLGALIYFIHHVAQSLQAAYLLRVIRGEVDREIERMFPETLGEAVEDMGALEEVLEREAGARAEAHEVRAEQEGYLRRVDEEGLAEACRDRDIVVVPVAIGARVRGDTVVARLWPAGAPQDDGDRIRRAFQLDAERSTSEDVLFGVRQLVDIALKALSPGVNDPTTAEQALAELVGATALLVRREMPRPVRRLEGSETRFLFAVPTFERIVDESFSQIRRAARAHVHVTLALLEGLRGIVERAPPRRAEVIAAEAAQVLEALPGAGFTAADAGRVRQAAWRVLAAAGGGALAEADGRRATDGPGDEDAAPPRSLQ